MVDQKSINKQLKKIDFNPHGWNKSEIAELHNIILPDEEIYECVNGLYEGGFALLVASDTRVLLIDKKPLGFLNVEDLRFDMINEIDYNHRMMGASITITTGSKTLNFRSYNKERLRKLIGHVQHCMASNKKKESSSAEDQKQHLEQINNQLQAYLVAQYKQQQKLQDHLTKLQSNKDNTVDPVQLEEAELSPQLKDYLYAHGLMEKYREEKGMESSGDQQQVLAELPVAPQAETITPPPTTNGSNSQLDEIYADGIQEVFGKRTPATSQSASAQVEDNEPNQKIGLDPLKIAISKLPQVLRNRKFGLGMPSVSLKFPLSEKR